MQQDDNKGQLQQTLKFYTGLMLRRNTEGTGGVAHVLHSNCENPKKWKL